MIFQTNNRLKGLFLVLGLFIIQYSFAFENNLKRPINGQDGSVERIEEGSKLFNANCASCHALNNKVVGPALVGVVDKYGEDYTWLLSWIKNNQKLVKGGDERANKIYAEYNGSAMTAFPQFSDEDIDNILAYTAKEKAAPPVAAAGTTQATVESAGGVSQEIVLGALAILFALLALGLFLVNKTLRRFASANNVEIFVE